MPNWVTGVVVYSILWWLVLFCVLPIGVKQADATELGHDPGAPANPRLVFKALLTTAITTILFAVIYTIIASNWISFRGQ